MPVFVRTRKVSRCIFFVYLFFCCFRSEANEMISQSKKTDHRSLSYKQEIVFIGIQQATKRDQCFEKKLLELVQQKKILLGLKLYNNEKMIQEYLQLTNGITSTSVYGYIDIIPHLYIIQLQKNVYFRNPEMPDFDKNYGKIDFIQKLLEFEFMSTTWIRLKNQPLGHSRNLYQEIDSYFQEFKNKSPLMPKMNELKNFQYYQEDKAWGKLFALMAREMTYVLKESLSYKELNYDMLLRFINDPTDKEASSYFIYEVMRSWNVSKRVDLMHKMVEKAQDQKMPIYFLVRIESLQRYYDIYFSTKLEEDADISIYVNFSDFAEQTDFVGAADCLQLMDSQLTPE